MPQHPLVWRLRIARMAPAVAVLVAASMPGICATKVAPPDEAGLVPIIMYHSVGERIGRHRLRYDRLGLNIAPATFRKQLEMMWRAGWYPIDMRDAVSPRMNVPAGRTPVVLTFDDARGSQFCFLPNGRIDPNCAVGILEAFSRHHPDWPLRATFYVMPQSRYNPVPFWQRGRAKAKLDWLLHAGCEIGNHSVSHGWMSRMSAARIQWEVAEAIRRIRRLAPSATMDTFCVPYGAMPRTHALRLLLANGHDGPTRYHNQAVLMAWGGPSYPPAHRRYNPLRIPRIGTAPGEVESIIRSLSRNHPRPRYVSDGVPDTVTVPRWAAKEIDPRRLDGARLVVLPLPIRAKPLTMVPKHPAAVR